MGRYSDFEQLPVWQAAKALALAVYKVTQARVAGKDVSLMDQMRRCAISVSSNIAEGFGRGSDKEFLRYLTIARGSCHELRSQVIIAYELEYLQRAGFRSLHNLATEVAAQLGAFARYLKAKPSA